MQDIRSKSDAADTSLIRRLTLAAALLGAVVLVVGTVGPPLFGKGVFLTDDTIFYAYPWRAHENPGVLDVAHHGPTTDTVDAIYPTRVRFADAARDGNILGWDPLVVGGMAVGSESTSGVLSAFAWLYLLLPSWYAPAGIKVLQMAVAIGFTYLFCRRVGTTRIPALFAGMAYAGSGFLVMWTNWQQPEIAALIPALFWATERYLQRPGVTTAIPIAVALASMLLGGFPSVVGYALYVLVGYVAIRLLAAPDRPARRRIAAAGGAGVGMVAGILLAAAVLVPFAAHLGDLDLGRRDEAPDDNLGVSTLVTTVAPDALGLSSNGPDAEYFGMRNQVEGISFVGVTTALAALVALCLPGPHAMPRGVRAALAAAAVGLGWATFAGGFPLRLLQNLPVFSDNFIGRTRSILGFTVAVLAALGLQALLERRQLAGRRGWIVAGSVVAATTATSALVGDRALDLARSVQQADVLRSGLVLPLAVGVAAVGLFGLVRMGPRWAAEAGLVGMIALLVVESLRLSLPLLPNEDRSQLYPTTPGIEFLADSQGSDRIAPEGFTLFGNAAALFGIRSVTGHMFNATTWKQAVRAADPQAFDRSPTYAALRGDEAVMASPILDRLGVRWFAATAQHAPAGRPEDHGLAGATCERPVALSSSLAVAIPAGDGLRAVVVQTCAAAELPHGSMLRTDVRQGQSTAVGWQRFTGTVVPAQELALAVPAEAVRGNGESIITLTLDGADGRTLPLATTATGDLGLEVVRPVDDGLRLAFADDLRIYERTTALPRLRWASRSIVIDDTARRLTALSGGTIDRDTVVLSEPGHGSNAIPAATGEEADAGGAELAVVIDSPTAIELTVEAESSGYVVVADALQTGWAATVDGKGASLVQADHAGVAVEVPAGRHDVELRYRPRGQRAGLAISSLTALGLLAAVVWERRRRRRHG